MVNKNKNHDAGFGMQDAGDEGVQNPMFTGGLSGAGCGIQNLPQRLGGGGSIAQTCLKMDING
jgi:hypothetical protein